MSSRCPVSSGDENPVRAIENSTDAANYRAEGDQTAVVDVATATYHHRGIRLSMLDTGRAHPVDEVILDVDNARRLIDRLTTAIGWIDAANKADDGMPA